MDATTCVHISIFGILLLSIRLCSANFVEDLFSLTFDKDYKKNLPPVTFMNDSGILIPVDVEISLQILRNPIVKEEEQEISMNVIIRFSWSDHRLHNEHSRLSFAPPEFIDQMWLPQITFRPMKELKYSSGMSDSRSVMMYYFSGEKMKVWYSMTCSLELICEMEFDLYPLDVQMCQWEIDTQQLFVNLTWSTRAPIQIKQKEDNNDLELPSFKFRFETSQKSTEYYDKLLFTIYLRRELSTHLLMTYFPSGLLVIISWCSFIIDPNMVPGRVALMVTSLLTLVTMFNSLRQKLQPSFDVKPVEVWIMVCMTFVVAALLEYALILLGVRCKAVRKDYKSEMVFAMPPRFKPMLQKKVTKSRWKCVNVCGRWRRAFGSILRREGCIDAISLFVFPLAFLAFNAYYWIHHLTNMNKKWEGFIAGKQEE